MAEVSKNGLIRVHVYVCLWERSMRKPFICIHNATCNFYVFKLIFQDIRKRCGRDKEKECVCVCNREKESERSDHSKLFVRFLLLLWKWNKYRPNEDSKHAKWETKHRSPFRQLIGMNASANRMQISCDAKVRLCRICCCCCCYSQ